MRFPARKIIVGTPLGAPGKQSLTFPLGYANIFFAMPTHRAGVAYAEVLESADRHV